jgi:hypothetical protein
VIGLAGNGRYCLPLRANRLSACGARTRSARSCLHREVTDIFTTAMPKLARRQMARWGTGDIGISDGNTVASFEPSALWRVATPCMRRLHSACVKGGIRTRFTRDAKYPTSSPPALVEPQTLRQTKFLLRRRCAADCELRKSSLCHRCPAHRLVPSGRPRALRPRASPREPRDPGLPFRLRAGQCLQ